MGSRWASAWGQAEFQRGGMLGASPNQYSGLSLDLHMGLARNHHDYKYPEAANEQGIQWITANGTRRLPSPTSRSLPPLLLVSITCTSNRSLYPL